MRMSVHMHVWTRVYMHACTYPARAFSRSTARQSVSTASMEAKWRFVCTHVRTHVCTHVNAHVYTHVHTEVHTHVCSHVYTHAETYGNCDGGMIDAFTICHN